MVEDWAGNGEFERLVVFSTDDKILGESLFEALNG